MARRNVKAARKRKTQARKAPVRNAKSHRHAARKPSRLSGKPDPLDDFIAAGARALGLKANKAWMPAVRGHLQVTLRHGALVAAFALPDDAEPAPVFKA